MHELAEQAAVNALQTQSLKMKLKELKEENEAQQDLIMNFMTKNEM